MQLDPKDLGPMGTLKSAVNAAIVMAVVGIVLTWRDDFDNVATLAGLGAATWAFCAIVEWIFRGYHREQVDRCVAAQEKATATRADLERIVQADRTATLYQLKRTAFRQGFVLIDNGVGQISAVRPVTPEDKEP